MNNLLDLKKPVIVFLFIIILFPLSASEKSFIVTFGAGMALDMAPFGIDNTYISLQCGIETKGPVTLGFKPLVSFNNDSIYARFPLIIGYRFKWILPYGGAGIEFSRFYGENKTLPFLTVGLQFFFDPFFIDVPVTTVLKGYDEDTDISLVMGLYFSF